MSQQDYFEIAAKLRHYIEAAQAADAAQAEQFRIQILGSKGELKTLFAGIREVPNDRKKEFGQLVNDIKQLAEQKLASWQEQFATTQKQQGPGIDLTRPVVQGQPGSRHPLSLIRNDIIRIFERIGFTVAEGPEVEDDWHNFTALNLPQDHPARDMQDTFFLRHNPDMVLRTHTSPVQIRYMEQHRPPIRIISPGRVFRVDNDSTHSPVFHQVEGLYIAKGVSFAELKQTLYYFVNEMFGEGTNIRFRPSFFPFTEPSAEMDIAWEKDGKPAWMEIMGCGMVDPNVLENCKIDPDIYTGYAFGMGVERIAMLKYGIRDIRLFYENDIRFLQQFTAAR